MHLLQTLLDAVKPSATRRSAVVFSELRTIRENLGRLSDRAAETQRDTERLLDAYGRDARERARLAALPRAKLLSDAVVLEGSPGQRIRVERHSVGEPVERRFSAWMGVTRCASEAPDVRALWDRLLARESECEDVLQGFPSTVLDVPGATVSMNAAGPLRVSLDNSGRGADTVYAIPRFTYDCPPRKLRNFGHWLLDCVPQVAVIATIAPHAVFLLPAPLRKFHVSILSLVGLTEQQMLPWDGAPIASERVLVFESDGRTGGGRPLSALMEMRRIFTRSGGAPEAARGRRIYVSRRDARNKRRWLSNEPDVEALFRSRGFEVLVMADWPIADQVRIFREAAVVAGISGAGLSGVMFSRPGTHVIALISEGLIRWYADRVGQRSAWANVECKTGGQLAALGDSPRFYAHLAAALEQYCHCFVGADEMPIDVLGGFLDEVLRRVDA